MFNKYGNWRRHYPIDQWHSSSEVHRANARLDLSRTPPLSSKMYLNQRHVSARASPKPADHSQRLVAFHDPSSLPTAPGWPLRNTLYYLSHTHSITTINILCLRAGSASRQGCVSLPSEGGLLVERPHVVGWERNKAGKLASRIADLGPMMDPAR